jgi:hypothetical protein
MKLQHRQFWIHPALINKHRTQGLGTMFGLRSEVSIVISRCIMLSRRSPDNEVSPLFLDSSCCTEQQSWRTQGKLLQDDRT